MIAALVLTAALQATFGGAEVTSTLEAVDGASAAVGAKVLWTVRVDDPGRSGASLSEPELGAEWAVLDGPDDVIEAGVAKAERADVLRSWTLMPLAGGALTTPALVVTFADGETVTVPEATVEVTGALGADEDAARPFAGFREAPDRRVGDASAAMWGLGGLLAALVGFLFWRRRDRAGGGVAAAAQERPIDLMHRLGGRLETGAEPPASVMATLGPLFRRAFDESLDGAERERRSALTDDAWAEDTRTGSEGAGSKLAGGEDAARLITELSAYRYGGGLPTSFAAKDALGRALELARGTAVVQEDAA